VTWPLFDGLATHYKVRAAEAEESVKVADLQDIEQSIALDIVKAHADAESSYQNLQISEDLLRFALAAVESSQRRYRTGAADIVELLSTQTALEEARSQRVQSLAEWRSARLTLLATAGLLDRRTL
jgi:outer membrane protein